MHQNSIKFLTPEDFELIATDFWSKYNPLNQIPIDIEEIIELALGIGIFSVPNLKKDRDIDAYISIDFKTITIDDNIYTRNEQRARFSFAHEVAHYLLHQTHINQANIKSVDDYIKFQNEIDANNLKKIEQQAYILAGHILAPTSFLNPVIDRALKVVGKAEDLSASEALSLLHDLCVMFNVSQGVIARRLKSVSPEIYSVIEVFLT